jgi:hypothetical protein
MMDTGSRVRDKFTKQQGYVRQPGQSTDLMIVQWDGQRKASIVEKSRLVLVPKAKRK